ncbi:RidA family protein [Comamonas endophytica]|uniref:RidA family protein n=1 Tax=Comamonas endophytica TaxID=2949090 RepID=A0ABY6G7X6_9BURK|nr:RidA family protein [Acidovorax sp. 5MLIR]MCD2511293.1 RidA family protein [Acidovorax sp. D4N7]UYG50687.1 RidA family protein [Acidovorax sp. 5MLIR]
MPGPTERAAAPAFGCIGGPVVRAGVAQPISQATAHNGLLFVSGQVPMVAGRPAAGDIAGQTHCVLDMIAAILAQAGAGLEHVLKVNVWLTHAEDYPAFHAAYGERFAQAPHPARSTVISGLIAPVRIEMEVIAALPGA